MNYAALGTLLVSTLAIGWGGSARADLIIDPSGDTTDTWIAETGQSVPTGTAGFVGGTLVAEKGTTYKFTYGPPPPIGVNGGTGHGNSTNQNEFKVGNNVFCTQATADCGGVASAVGASFTVHLDANTIIPFQFIYDLGGASGVGPHTLDNGQRDDANGAYLVQLFGPDCPSLTQACAGPSSPMAFLGLADNPYPADRDFQDMTILVSEVPVPASLALFAARLIGLAALRRRRHRPV